jgi:hypothetical protein
LISENAASQGLGRGVRLKSAARPRSGR